MGIYYNRDLIDTVPDQWSTFANILKKPSTESSPMSPTAVSENNNLLNIPAPMENKVVAEQPAFSNLGYGRETPDSPDIIALLTVQKK